MEDDAARVRELIDYWTPLLLRMCVDAGVIRAFGRSNRSADEVAVETGTHGPTVARVLRALSSRGVFEERDDGTYRLSAVGRRLLPDEPGSLSGLAAFRPSEIHAWAEAGHSLRTGQQSFQLHFGQSFWDHLGANPPVAKKFDEQMRQRTTTMLDLGLSLYEWPEVGTVVDIGGGNGVLLSRVLTHKCGLRGVLFDLPHVTEHAAPRLRSAGVADRVDIVGGDMFVDELPSGHDIYVLASVLHDWGDAEAGRILRRCRDAMPPAARLVLFESVLPIGPEPDLGKMVDLNMLVLFGAKERTELEWTRLLHQSGLDLVRIVPTPGLSWIEAFPRA
jgi:O-methyltransferase domain